MADKEFIRAITPIQPLLERYGVAVRNGRCRGFCHNGHDYNMAVYRDSCYCYVCNKGFDCFEIVQFFENCDFKESVRILTGGKNIDPETESREIAQRRLEAVEKARTNERIKILAEEHRSLLHDIEQFKPLNPADFVSDVYVNALHRINQVKAELSELLGVVWI